MLAEEIVTAEQAQLLAVIGDEDCGAAPPRTRQLLGELQQHRDAGAIVRRTDVPGVMVRTDQQGRTFAGQPPHHVVAGGGRDVRIHAHQGEGPGPGSRDQFAPVALADADGGNGSEPVFGIGDGPNLHQVVRGVADVDEREGAAGDRLAVLRAAMKGDVPLDERHAAVDVAAVVVRRLTGADVHQGALRGAAAAIGERLVRKLAPGQLQRRAAQRERGEMECLQVRVGDARGAEALEEVGGAGRAARAAGALVSQ